jgi:hypothetical protein
MCFKVCLFIVIQYHIDILSGLDVVGFSQFKRAWATLLFELGHSRAVKKDNYLQLIEGPFIQAFTPANIKAGFKKTGVWPFNDTVITPAMMAPSIPNSAVALFPMPQASPVRALAPFIKLAAWNPPFSLDPTSQPSTSMPTTTLSGVDDISTMFGALEIGSDGDLAPNAAQPPLLSPSIPQAASPPQDPQLHPLSQAQQALEALRQTASASYLVNEGPIPEEIILPPPILTAPPPVQWPKPLPSTSALRMSRQELLTENKNLRENLSMAMAHISQQDEIIRGNNAQMILQWLHVSKIDDTRVAVAKTARQTVFPGGNGVELTGNVFVSAAQARVNARNAEDAAKAARAKEMAVNKALKAAQDEAWRVETENTENAVAEWNKHYQDMTKAQLAAAGAPKKPSRRLKSVVHAEVLVLQPDEGAFEATAAVQDVVQREDFTSAMAAVVSDEEGSEYSPYHEG